MNGTSGLKLKVWGVVALASIVTLASSGYESPRERQILDRLENTGKEWADMIEQDLARLASKEGSHGRLR